METTKAEKVLEPTLTGTPKKGSIIAPIVSESDSMDEPKKGEVLAVRIGANGQEIAGSAFYIGERTFNKSFANNPSYKIKKKHLTNK